MGILCGKREESKVAVLNDTKRTVAEQDVSAEKEIAKYTIKDSVFTNLFQDKKYLVQLYKALHPEDADVCESELYDVTIRNVLTDNIYNDLGFRVGDRLVILVESQATWTVNIIIRALMYMVQTYHNYFLNTKQNLYKSQKVAMPKPELYVIFTGKRQSRPEEISLAKEFFAGDDCCIDVKVKMIYDGKEGDIINQYVVFTQVCSEQIRLYGRTRQAVSEAIRICKDRNVLREYLSSKEKEVIDIMMVLYDEEEVMRSYVESEVNEAILDARVKMATDMIRGNEPLEKVVKYSGLPEEKVLELFRGSRNKDNGKEYFFVAA